MESPPRNRFLASLSAEAYGRLAPALRTLRVASGAPLPDCGKTRVYFPETSACSIFSSVADGRSIEVTSVGNEGVVGLPQLVLAPEAHISWRHIGDGTIRYAPMSVIRSLSADQEFAARCHAYQERFTRQMMQSVVCHGWHGLRARCATWILVTHERLGRARFELTQGLLAETMGVELATLRPVSARLSVQHILKYDKSTVTIHDRIALRQLACSCYAALRPASATPMTNAHSINREDTDVSPTKIIAIRPAATCALCGLARGLPHESHHACLRAIDAEMMTAIRQVRALTHKRTRLVEESLLKYRRLIKTGAIAQ